MQRLYLFRPTLASFYNQWALWTWATRNYSLIHTVKRSIKRLLQPHVHTRPLTRSSTHSLAYSTTNHSHQRQHPLTHSPSSLTRSYIQPSTHSLTNSCKSQYIAEQSVKITYSHYVEFFVLRKVCRNVVLSQSYNKGFDK